MTVGAGESWRLRRLPLLDLRQEIFKNELFLNYIFAGNRSNTVAGLDISSADLFLDLLGPTAPPTGAAAAAAGGCGGGAGRGAGGGGGGGGGGGCAWGTFIFSKK